MTQECPTCLRHTVCHETGPITWVTLVWCPSSIRNVREGPTGHAVWPEASGRIAGVGSCVRGARDGVFYVKSQANLPLTDTMKTRFGLESP
jgi:hypothetical protein